MIGGYRWLKFLKGVLEALLKKNKKFCFNGDVPSIRFPV